MKKILKTVLLLMTFFININIILAKDVMFGNFNKYSENNEYLPDYKEKITEVYFVKDTKENILSNYNNYPIHFNLASSGDIKAWLVPDNDMYKFYIVSPNKIYLSNGNRLFQGWKNLKKIDFSNADTSDVTIMSYMFYGDENLESLDLSNFNTANVINMEYMFTNCSALESLNLSNFNTTNVTNMSFMFLNDSSLTNLDLTNFNTEKVTDMQSMFQNCMKLSKVLINFNTKNVTNMSYMFAGCSNLEKLILNFDTANVKKMEYMFAECTSLSSISLNFNTEKVDSMASMFYHCLGLTSIDLNNFDFSNVDDTSSMFQNCYYLKNISPMPDTKYVANTKNMYENCGIYDKASSVMLKISDNIIFNREKIKEVYFIEENEENINARYDAATLKSDLTYENIGMVKSWLEGDKLYIASPTKIILKDASELFYDWNNLEKVEFNNLDTSNVTDMSYMFANTKVVDLDLSTLNTSNVINMSYMFNNCTDLKDLDLSSFDTSNVIDMSYMFDNCAEIKDLDLSNFDTANVTNMSHMFNNCNSLENLNIDNFDTKNVTNTNSMFRKCYYLNDLNTTDFDMSNVTDQLNMYLECGIYHKNWSKMLGFDKTITDYKNQITEVYFIEEDNERYSISSIKTDLTYNNVGSVKAWLEPDIIDLENEIQLYKLYVASNGITELIKGTSLFENWSNLVKIVFENVNTEAITNMDYMFKNCPKLEYLDISSFDFTNVKSKMEMFDANITVVVPAKDIYDSIKDEVANVVIKNQEDKIITIASGYTAEYISLLFANAKIYNKNNQLKENDTFIGTGEYITLDNTYNFAVIGDIDGNGELDLVDIMQLARIVYSDSKITNKLSLISADFDLNDEHDLQDIMKLANRIYKGV